MPTPDQCEAAYHSGIGELLTAAYRREFSMLEKGKCKTKYPIFYEWHAALNAEQRQSDKFFLFHLIFIDSLQALHQYSQKVTD
jgi:hypothetical protein